MAVGIMGGFQFFLTRNTYYLYNDDVIKKKKKEVMIEKVKKKNGRAFGRRASCAAQGRAPEDR